MTTEELTTQLLAQLFLDMLEDDAPVPMLPTKHTPGTLGKMKVMRARFMRGEQLHHPDDNKDTDHNQVDPFYGERAYGAGKGQNGSINTGLGEDAA